MQLRRPDQMQAEPGQLRLQANDPRCRGSHLPWLPNSLPPQLEPAHVLPLRSVRSPPGVKPPPRVATLLHPVPGWTGLVAPPQGDYAQQRAHHTQPAAVGVVHCGSPASRHTPKPRHRSRVAAAVRNSHGELQPARHGTQLPLRRFRERRARAVAQNPQPRAKTPQETARNEVSPVHHPPDLGCCNWHSCHLPRNYPRPDGQQPGRETIQLAQRPPG